MMDVATIAAAITVALAVLGAFWKLVLNRSAGSGSVLEAQNKVLSDGYNQLVSILKNDRDEHKRQIEELKDQIAALNGKLDVYRREYAVAIAEEVTKSVVAGLEASGWIKVGIPGAQGPPGVQGERGPAGQGAING